jgi:predicted aldo/keto reductase-like oxidoreductase
MTEMSPLGVRVCIIRNPVEWWGGMSIDRRHFIRAAAATAFLASLGRQLGFAADSSGMPYRRLGKTGEKVSLLGVGGAHLAMGSISEAEAISVVRTAMDNGVNFLDNSWDYSNGDTEVRMGRALLNGYRDHAFLMTKIDGRSARVASMQLDQSLQRLQTDHLDLIQIHDISRMEDAERIFAPDGAIHGLEQARKAGKVRFIGFTGHKSPEVHLHVLDVAEKHGFAFDTLQMPLNVMDAHFNSFAHQVVPVALKKNMGVIGMKPLGSGLILTSNTVTAVECLQFAMSLPLSVCLTGCDSMERLQQALGVARNFQPLTAAQVNAILAKTEVAAAQGQYEQYKVSSHFDNDPADPNLG